MTTTTSAVVDTQTTTQPPAQQPQPLHVGVIGCGNISAAYLKHAATFRAMRIVACADLNAEAAQAKAAQFKIDAMSVDALLSCPDIDVILNLTTPQAHTHVNTQALQANKHVYCEKPLATSLADAQAVLDLAREKKLRVGCAPDTFLGGGIQTCRKLIDDGRIGKPLAGTAMMMCPGHESWHPNPGFYYLKAGGPVLDMGPYYLTALVNLLGPMQAVQAMGSQSGPRICTSEHRRGEVLPVEVLTHVAGNIRFQCGAIITIIMSFDTVSALHNPIELHGSAGSLHVPDPNRFAGPVALAPRGGKTAEPVPLTHGYTENMRSIGLADMCDAILHNRPHRAGGALALHVLEAMLALNEAAGSGQTIELKTTAERPAAMAADLVYGTV